jgi:glycosyltransferase involved in cell wall biosynthesis
MSDPGFSPVPFPASQQWAERGSRVAVLIPCRNEALSIRQVVSDFRQHLPGAAIYVYDNRSTDETAAVAREAGAIVRRELWPGKGNVVRRMFADVDADIYLMADGDGTYDAEVAPAMVRRLLEEQVDMVVGTRKGVQNDAHRRGHGFGNRAFNMIYRRLIGPDFTDIFSGYRVFSRRFVKSFPAISSGFEIETEMSVHASQLRMPIAEVETEYRERAQGSASKLRTFRDAFRILSTLIRLFKETRPFAFFGIFAAVFTLTALVLGFPLLSTYLDTGLVPRFPTAILATGLMILAGFSLGCGLILDSVARGRLEQKRILYLAVGNVQQQRG